ncbi:MAG: sigma-70 family RNA polymerase sigma factor [Acidobacteria bacterium]|nr:sigma-70 family RNA polymerase sigma factor [Acidobacteriota bacterium]
MSDPLTGSDDQAPSPAAHATAILVDNHRAFLRYLERRVGSREAAEDILQDAFVRNLGNIESLPDDALVPWFYRVLRNATIDRSRRRAVADRALEAFAREVETAHAPSPDLQNEICACIGRLAGTLKPEYADALRAVDVDGLPVKDYAGARGISASNAGVRVFRARQALRTQVARSCGTCAEHGCLDCTCGKPCG